jgi:hypothetical protein
MLWRPRTTSTLPRKRLTVTDMSEPGRTTKSNPGILVSSVHVVLLALWAVLLVAQPRPAAASRLHGPDVRDPVPVMAYYYIWYDPQSWNRAKTDYPALGRYSSDDRAVMEQHVRWAKDAGIDGFIVSWKSTYKLDRRLEQLIDVAETQDFHLWIIYQGLDFDRNPLAIEHVANDIGFFIDRYAGRQAFSMYDRPVFIWSGTWEFTRQEIASVTERYGDKLLILASERNVDGYQRIADLVAGDAYYWSSVNPDTFNGYQAKLDAMSQAVHRHGGLWVAPAAPGFDARLVGGTTVVDRKDGDTLRTEMNVASRSSPDAIGLISWNEFSENSHIEPSQNYGNRYLAVLTDMEHGVPPQPLDFDSSAPATTDSGNYYTLYVLAGMSILVVASIVRILIVQSKSEESTMKGRREAPPSHGNPSLGN